MTIPVSIVLCTFATIGAIFIGFYRNRIHILRLYQVKYDALSKALTTNRTQINKRSKCLTMYDLKKHNLGEVLLIQSEINITTSK